jgi:hypothetical protein
MRTRMMRVGVGMLTDIEYISVMESSADDFSLN